MTTQPFQRLILPSVAWFLRDSSQTVNIFPSCTYSSFPSFSPILPPTPNGFASFNAPVQPISPIIRPIFNYYTAPLPQFFPGMYPPILYPPPPLYPPRDPGICRPLPIPIPAPPLLPGMRPLPIPLCGNPKMCPPSKMCPPTVLLRGSPLSVPIPNPPLLPGWRPLTVPLHGKPIMYPPSSPLRQKPKLCPPTVSLRGPRMRSCYRWKYNPEGCDRRSCPFMHFARFKSQNHHDQASLITPLPLSQPDTPRSPVLPLQMPLVSPVSKQASMPSPVSTASRLTSELPHLLLHHLNRELVDPGHTLMNKCLKCEKPLVSARLPKGGQPFYRYCFKCGFTQPKETTIFSTFSKVPAFNLWTKQFRSRPNPRPILIYVRPKLYSEEENSPTSKCVLPFSAASNSSDVSEVSINSEEDDFMEKLLHHKDDELFEDDDAFEKFLEHDVDKLIEQDLQNPLF